MDDMGTPSNNHPAAKALDRGSNPGRVVDLTAYRNNRYYDFSPATSQRRSTVDTPEMIKHENEAMAMGNPKPSISQKISKGMQWLGLTE